MGDYLSRGGHQQLAGRKISPYFDVDGVARRRPGEADRRQVDEGCHRTRSVDRYSRNRIGGNAATVSDFLSDCCRMGTTEPAVSNRRHIFVRALLMAALTVASHSVGTAQRAG